MDLLKSTLIPVVFAILGTILLLCVGFVPDSVRGQYLTATTTLLGGGIGAYMGQDKKD